MKIRQSMIIGLILLTLISSVSLNEALSESLIRQAYDSNGNLWGFVCNEYGQCRWVLIQPAPDNYSPPSKQYSPSPEKRTKKNKDSNSVCSLCKLCLTGSLAACTMVSDLDCKKCKKVSESDNRNINRMYTNQNCSLSKISCDAVCRIISEHDARRSCHEKCESEYKECLSKMK